MEFTDVITGITSIQISNDSNLIALSTGYKITVNYILINNKIKNAESNATLNTFTFKDQITNFEFSPDSNLLLVCMNKVGCIEARLFSDNQWHCKIEDTLSGILYARWSSNSRSILTFSDF